MKIENIDKISGVPISDIEVGECFMYKGEIHIKVNIGSIEYASISEFPNVVLNLENNNMNAIKDSVVVQRVDAKVVIN